MNTKRMKFGDLKIGGEFRYNNLTFHKTNVVDVGTVLYNAITDRIGEGQWAQQKIVYLPDDKLVTALVRPAFVAWVYDAQYNALHEFESVDAAQKYRAEWGGRVMDHIPDVDERMDAYLDYCNHLGQ